MGLRLFGITALDGHNPDRPGEGLELLAFRDLAALVGPSEFKAGVPAPEDLELYQRVVESVFSHRPVLPAPVGTVFRSQDTLVRWMELHYVALHDALAFLEDRAVARVHIRRKEGDPRQRDEGVDLASVAAESFRTLRRRAVVALPLKTEHLTGIVLSSAFLIERDQWKEFMEAVREEQRNNPQLQFETTGPWPPYDFVRMQFGA
jgi:hypothetical protein